MGTLVSQASFPDTVHDITSHTRNNSFNMAMCHQMGVWDTTLYKISHLEDAISLKTFINQWLAASVTGFIVSKLQVEEKYLIVKVIHSRKYNHNSYT
jgi:hypothetical protein